MKVPYQKEHQKIIVDLINKYFPGCEISIFGSRADNTFKETSDLDLCLKSSKHLDLANWAKLEEEIAQTDIPFKVDLVDWHRVSPEFQKIISSKKKNFS
jgi:predicted nucleotidyltransferase